LNYLEAGKKDAYEETCFFKIVNRDEKDSQGWLEEAN
jgi:hypothetical protein